MTDWTRMAVDLRAVRAENEISVALRRGETTLTAQLMRLEMADRRSAFRFQSAAASESRMAMVILGEPDMDIAINDRLYGRNILFRVAFIQPNRLAATIAEAVAVE